ncbi:minor tail protein [Gordonia phage Kudefre]|uniref:Minor tail protein n=1 Tax=Gordonia phage Kudefre TaxID=2885975 RepID=A0AAE9C1Y8_9CAUD|nr:minor tail protein [Gordonia phage Kudefre]UDL15265.1 minor tail protein [Gordonia phage Kudefre]
MTFLSGTVNVTSPGAPPKNVRGPGGGSVKVSPAAPGPQGPPGDKGDPGPPGGVPVQSGNNRLYANDGSGNPTTIPFSSAATAQTAVYRTTGGVTNFGEPSAPSHAATKNYVDVSLASKVDTSDARLSDARPLRMIDVSTSVATGTAAKTVTGTAPVAGDMVMLRLPNGNTVANPTVSFNGAAAIPIRPGNQTSPVSTSVAITAGGLMLLYYDGTALQLISSTTPPTEIPDAEIVAGTATASRYITGRRTATIINQARSGVELQSNKGAANGYASLDAGGKVPISQLPSSLMEYLGVWNASTNSPTLANGTGNVGDVYRVTSGGTRNLGAGNITFDVGDYVIYNGTVWEKSDTTDAVASVAGKTGVVTLNKNDVGLSNVDNTSDLAKPVSTATQTALNGKVNVLPTPWQLYATDAAGLTGMQYSANDWAAWTIVQRGDGGVVKTGTPVADNDSATKAYVDSKIVFGPLPATGQTGVLYVVP